MLPFLLFPLLMIGGYIGNMPETETEIRTQDQLVQTYTVKRFKLFQTQNMWTFIKLDTQTGQIWQLQYSVDDNDRFEYDLNPYPLVTDENKVNGRFELYPTQNIYNFILIDQIDGRTWQVQWSIKDENQAILPISR